MQESFLYQIVSHLDEPKRCIGLSVDELCVVILGLLLLTISNHKLLVGALCLVIYGFLKHLKQGNSPRFLLLQFYWHMPAILAQLFLRALPKAYYRLWRG